MRTLKLLAMLAPLCCTTAACTAILGGFDFEGKPGSTGGTGGTGGTGATGGTGGTGGSTPLTINPMSAKVGVFRPQTLTASAPVTWSVMESGGGTVDAQGKYVSPATPGTYHVVAKSQVDGSTAAATITVVPLGLNVVGGIAGGRGNVDGPAARAHFDGISAAAFSSDPNPVLLLTDSNNHTVRKYDPSTQKVTTIAGAAGVSGTTDGTGSAARFNDPKGIVVIGKIAFVADGGNNCIRAVDYTTGIVTTLSGLCGSATAPVDAATGAASRFDSLRGMTVNEARTALYVCEVGSNVRDIRRVDLTTGGTKMVVTNLNSCDISQPGFQAPNPIWYTDGNNPSQMHRFTEGPGPNYTPTIETFANLPYTSSDGMAVADSFGGDHWVYMSFQRSAVIRFDIDTLAFETVPVLGKMGEYGYADGVGTAVRFGQIEGLVPDFGHSRFYVIDSGLAAIREVDQNTFTVTTSVGAADIADRIDGPQNVARLTAPVALAADEAGALYIGDVTFDSGPLNNTIRLRDAKSGAISTLAGSPNAPNMPAADGQGTNAKFSLPFDAVYDAGAAYVIDLAASAIRKVAKDGQVTTIAGELGVPGNSDGFGAAAHFSFGLQSPSFGMAVDHKGNLYVSDGGNYSIRKVVLATGEVTTIAGGTKGTSNGVGAAAQFLAPAGLAVDGNTLYIADAEDQTIRQMDLTTMAVTSFIGASGTPGYKDGDVSVTLFETPFRLLADGIGNLFVLELGAQSDGGIGTIRRIDIAARVSSTFAGTRGVLGLVPGPLTTATLNGPFAMALMPNGDLAISDVADHAIAVIGAL